MEILVETRLYPDLPNKQVLKERKSERSKTVIFQSSRQPLPVVATTVPLSLQIRNLGGTDRRESIRPVRKYRPELGWNHLP